MKSVPFAEFRAGIDALGQAGATGQALARLRRRAEGDPPLFECRWLAEQLARFTPEALRFKLGILSSYTIEPIRDVLRARGLAAGFDLDLYFGGFQQFEQELLTIGSGLARHEPQAVILAWRLEELSPPLVWQSLDMTDEQLDAEIDALLQRVGGLVAGAARNLPKASCLLHRFVAPQHAALGLIDAEHPRGHEALVGRLNAGLVELCRRTPGAHLIDCGALARRVGATGFDARHWYTAQAPAAPALLSALAAEYVKAARAVAGKTKKVLVVDLDNTLWGGILGEDGLEGIRVGPEYPGSAFADFQREVKRFGQRGVVLAVNSKNNEADVRAAFETHAGMVLRWTDFAATRVNWQDKAQNLRELAQELSLGLDSFVFVDDNPAELEIVQQQLPQVSVVQAPREAADLPGLLSRLGLFDGLVFSDEDRQRGAFYQAQAQRAELARSAGADLESYYESLGMRLTMLDVGEAEVARVSQLTHRTNQFNMTTRRYGEAEIRALVASPSHLVRAFRLEDRFGDNGIIAVVILAREGEHDRIDTFLMSCRVIGRSVEEAIVALMAEEARARGSRALLGEFLPTKKNAPAQGVYERLGFAKTAESAAGATWQLDLSEAGPELPRWFEVAGAAVRT